MVYFRDLSPSISLRSCVGCSVCVSLLRGVMSVLRCSKSSTVCEYSLIDNMYKSVFTSVEIQFEKCYSTITRTVCRDRSLHPVTVHPLPNPLSLPLMSAFRLTCSAISALRCPAVNRSPLITTGMPGGYGHI